MVLYYLFCVRVSVTLHLMYVHIIFSSVKVTEWSSFGKELLTRLTTCSLCTLTICYFSYFPFWFESWIWVLIVSFPDHCLLLTFTILHVQAFGFCNHLHMFATLS